MKPAPFITALVLTLMLLCSSAFGAPFMVSDPNTGAEAFGIDFPEAGININLVAQPDGSLLWDMATWTGGPGWHSGTVVACESYSVEDLTTNNVTSVTSCSDPAPFRIRVPNHEWNKNFKIQE